MRRTSAWVGWALCLCTALAASAQDYPEDDKMILDLIREDGTQPETGDEPAAEFLKCNKPSWRMQGQYLVVLRQGTHDSHVQRTIRRLRAKAARRGYLLEIMQTYSGALHGFLVKMSSEVLHLAVKLPQVHYIEEDSIIFAQSAPWNLQRILQPHGGTSENGTYRPPNDGGMAEVYLMDGSVQSSHREIEGRVLITDFNSVPEEDGVRVHRQVITVGAVNSADQLMSQGAGGTNFGRCIDLFAPGDDIVSASSDCSTCFTSRSGTSQAAAHAAGIAAVILSSKQNASPVQVLQMMLHYSISNTINFLSLSDTHRLITPNLVAAMPPANSANGELLCRSVWSERSGVTSTDKTISRCRLGEEMMSCSSYSPDGVHVGETITVSSGQMECVAFNAPEGKGVYAVARCCVIGGLQCHVHARPEPGRDAECVGPQHHLTGCTSWSTAEISSDSRPHHGDRKRCVVKDGMTSHAVCCHAPSLECHLLENRTDHKDQVEVSCPSGWTLTDCSAVSQGSAILAPVAKGNRCRVGSVTGDKGAAGIAVCCRVRPPERQPTTPQ
ncbi:proprotein convertase subtilisin/kexin type 9 isoform X2 [Cottoperca gobio]|uniref:Proprotein convertase subtilisin/kexin type 9 n=1 Tax=Cottoperca gobio TaxID=56716 RepID=A0A6J2PK90_COTGO|nr:proprotein convertase subtilisin/kexin type 9 isoform X2 [Cottoperca gobio]